MIEPMSSARPTLILFASLAVTAHLASAASADVPVVGQPWQAPKLKSWLEATPSADDAAGKVTVHWFCKPKVEACADDLARIFNMREQKDRFYVVAYIAGTAREAGKLDPVRGDVGAGAVAYGKPVIAMFKSMGIGNATLPMAIVVGPDGNVAMVTTTGDPEQLDRRDAKIASMVSAIHEYTLVTSSPSGTVKVGQAFDLGVKIDLASWLRFAAERPATLTFTPPPDVTCERTKVTADQMKVSGSTIEASVRCTATVKGPYEASGRIQFDFVGPRKSVGLGDQGLRWKFEVRP
jgi:hypothetical protein